MLRRSEKGEAVRRFILANVELHPGDITKVTADKFSISTQAVNLHTQKLVESGMLHKAGGKRDASYKLAELRQWSQTYALTPQPDEEDIWFNDVRPVLGELPENVMDIWRYGFTEMFNNALEHSAATNIIVQVKKSAASAEMVVSDDGIGIFKKIQETLKLSDERHAVLALSKGKLTTDPAHHSGQGIFFTSRIFDSFDIVSGGVFFSHKFGSHEDWISQRNFQSGTTVWLKLSDYATRTQKEIIDLHSTPDSFEFDKTIVPVKVATYGSDKLFSRSQAQRLMADLDDFKVVILDFKEVDTIGQGFADEIFRVFRRAHPAMEIDHINASEDVERMIRRAEATKT
jgi:anti-sigma regulatory factor (Ser/Thr protein kinase)